MFLQTRSAARLLRLATSTYKHCVSSRCISTNSGLVEVTEEVEYAVKTGKPVVALETTIYTHGFPYPENVALASHLESLVRVNGGVPATIGILHGRARVGMSADDIIDLISTAGSEDTWKVSRRDLGLISGLGLRGRRLNGGTTVSATMILAHLAGVRVFATGGLGGVHRGAETSFDISADLTELGRTPVAVVASGCKSFLDIPKTLEYLETQGVGVSTFADGRSGAVDFPAFFSRDSGVRSPHTIQTEADAAAIIYAQHQFRLQSGLLFANPVPEVAAMARENIDNIIQLAVAEAEQKGISGNKNTPYILKRIRELSKNDSVTANKALIEANVIRGTRIAVELSKLETQSEGVRDYNGNVTIPLSGPRRNVASVVDLSESSSGQPRSTPQSKNTVSSQSASLDVLVIGSIAADISCDYRPFTSSSNDTSPVMHTSNPASIAQSLGGVGCNVALAAHYAGANVALATVVADDLTGRSLLNSVQTVGIDTTRTAILPSTSSATTAQYISINDANKDLVLAMGDFSIFDHSSLEDEPLWSGTGFLPQNKPPSWVVLDGNIPPVPAQHILQHTTKIKTPVAFEPVSTVKGARLFEHSSTSAFNPTATVSTGNHCISLSTPNKAELSAMHSSAQKHGFLNSDEWWQTIDSFGLSSSGSRDKFAYMTTPALTDEGVPQQLIQLLPFIPNLLVKLGSQGSLLATVLRRNDPRLSDRKSAPHILSRTNYETGNIGGIYLRLFPPAAVVAQDAIVSVNGVGDTLLGVLMAGIIHQTKAAGLESVRIEDLVPIAQQAAVMTLKSRSAVSEEIKKMQLWK